MRSMGDSAPFAERASGDRVVKETRTGWTERPPPREPEFRPFSPETGDAKNRKGDPTMVQPPLEPRRRKRRPGRLGGSDRNPWPSFRCGAANPPCAGRGGPAGRNR